MSKTKAGDIDRKIGARIKARRVALKVTLEDLGEAIDVSFQQVQKLLNGTNRISAANLAKIAKRLDVPVAYFYGGDDGEATDDGMAFLGSREGARLVSAMAHVRDIRLKRAIVEAVERLADAARLADHPLREFAVGGDSNASAD